ncbi:preprotein translocase subunit YajC [Thalassobacillus hwangdonensis]|uniref:Preprotein translocase subunit YajC n=1 Tax=Thalassobacillus hwangdonensis TaxID=546108 RepID=A0ABW3KZA5_9BACI
MEGGLLGLLPIVAMFVIFYFLLIRPQQKKQKQIQQMQADLQKGNDIVTIGGLHGKINALDEGTVVIVIEDGTKLKFDRSAIRDVVNN